MHCEVTTKTDHADEKIELNDTFALFTFTSMESWGSETGLPFTAWIQSVEVWVTSEDNSYGLVHERWFDGVVDLPSLSFKPKNHSLGGVWSIVFMEDSYQTHIEIFQITEYKNLETICSSDSYFQWLAKQFERGNFSLVSKERYDKCVFNKTCYPYS